MITFRPQSPAHIDCQDQWTNWRKSYKPETLICPLYCELLNTDLYTLVHIFLLILRNNKSPFQGAFYLHTILKSWFKDYVSVLAQCPYFRGPDYRGPLYTQTLQFHGYIILLHIKHIPVHAVYIQCIQSLLNVNVLYKRCQHEFEYSLQDQRIDH